MRIVNRSDIDDNQGVYTLWLSQRLRHRHLAAHTVTDKHCGIDRQLLHQLLHIGGLGLVADISVVR